MSLLMLNLPPAFDSLFSVLVTLSMNGQRRSPFQDEVDRHIYSHSARRGFTNNRVYLLSTPDERNKEEKEIIKAEKYCTIHVLRLFPICESLEANNCSCSLPLNFNCCAFRFSLRSSTLWSSEVLGQNYRREYSSRDNENTSVSCEDPRVV